MTENQHVSLSEEPQANLEVPCLIHPENQHAMREREGAYLYIFYFFKFYHFFSHVGQHQLKMLI